MIRPKPDKLLKTRISSPRGRASRDTGFPSRVRKLIDHRDSDDGRLLPYVRAQCCGLVIRKEDGSRQHRIARGSGGSRNPVISSVINGVWMCGSATSRGHHAVAESRDETMYDRGFWRKQAEVDELPLIPVIRWDGCAYWPTFDGRWLPEAPAGGGPHG